MKKPTPFGKYYLLERINVGGMAEVFRAKAFGVEGFERLVAVKRILPNIAEDKEFIRMFIEEAKLAVQLNHANIAQIYDLGVNDGSYYIALEHVHGRDLRAIFDRSRGMGEPMPVSQACFIVMKLCEGLDYAHNKRDQAGRELHLVHRDVSPQNVLVSFEGEVKIIDFGIAKAAGKGSKTQAGILKGKFGYMSPEQVRGIPIDRRSDVFSCGIVLYELLTGERLFVGESDFSTLEKVRNVEILPPSTYNRRIPDELERIVLKALAKDPDERYQNAIDLHDELQAFVYTAGEFYSRKDLAGWMKKMFGREIDEESAKLEGYRQLKPPAPADAPSPAPRVTPRPASGQQPTAPMRKSTQAMPAVSPPSPTRPPPPPTARMSQQMPAVAAPKAKRNDDTGELQWDDDELETQIYDDPEQDPKRKKPTSSLPIAAPPAAAAHAAGSPAPAPPPVPPPGQPDLSSLVSTARGWEGPKPATIPPPLPVPTNGANGAPHGAPHGSGAHKAQDPISALAAPVPALPPLPPPPRSFAMPSVATEPAFDPMGQFGAGVLKKPKRSSSMLYIAVGGAALAVVAVVIVIATTGGKKPTKPDTQVGSAGSAGSAEVAPPAPGSAVAPAPTMTPEVAAATGFDLYVNPPGTMTWRLDGDARTDRLPSRIRGISPGPHTVAIDAPAGFMSQNQPVTVELGKAPKVEIVLQPIQGITGDFQSTPPGATVSLIVDGKRELLGPSPQKAPLDPRKTYQVLFEKAGYVSVNKPIVLSGKLDEPVVVSMEKAAGGSIAVAPEHPAGEHPAGEHPAGEHPAGEHPVSHPGGNGTHVASVGDGHPGGETPGETPEHPEHPVAAAGGKGTLILGSKPPCEIFVDGSDSGQHTPVPAGLKLDPGPHKITLVSLNTDFGIKETFTVNIKADATTKEIKDYSDRLPK
ncbi:MAG TPA: serine/threonine-protein kinase [Kofleriaceae bacterium]|nr:serine/threonine-protein kinase [Kofleriaceae bacterium]